MTVDDATVARWFGMSRAAFGLWLSLAPHKPAELWFGDGALPASTSALLRSVGARDIGLGLGLASNPPRDSMWLHAGIVADVGDAAAAVLARRRVPAKNFLTGFLGALVYAVVGVILAVRRKS